MIDGVLFSQNNDNVLLRFFEKDDVNHVLTELYDDPKGGHLDGETNAQKVLREAYYSPTLFRHAHAYAQKFQVCQVNACRERMPAFSLHHVIVQNPFE